MDEYFDISVEFHETIIYIFFTYGGNSKIFPLCNDLEIKILDYINEVIIQQLRPILCDQ